MNEQTERPTAPRRLSVLDAVALAVLILVCLTPMVLAVIIFSVGAHPTGALLVELFLIPIGAAVAGILVLRGDPHPLRRLLLTGGIVLLLLCLLFCSLLFTRFELSEDYEGEELTDAYGRLHERVPSVFPEDLSAFGAKAVCMSGFSAFTVADPEAGDNAYTLRLTYEENEYLSRKALADMNYVFQEDAMDPEDDFTPQAEAGEFYFRFLSVEGAYGEELSYPDCMVLVGFCDERCEIVYICYLGSASERVINPAGWLSESCGWRE